MLVTALHVLAQVFRPVQSTCASTTCSAQQCACIKFRTHWQKHHFAIDAVLTSCALRRVCPCLNCTRICCCQWRCRYEYSFRWWCVLIIAAHAVFFRVTSVLLLKYKNFLRR